MKAKWPKMAGIFIGVALTVFLAGWLSVRSSAFMEMAGATASEKATELLGVPVEIGDIAVESFHSLCIKDIAVYDRQAECIARAGEARVNFRLLSVFGGDPAAAVDEVLLRHVTANLVQREDGTWNAADIETKESGESTFRGKVRVEDGVARGRVQGKELTLQQVTAELDMSDSPVMKLEATAEDRGTKLRAAGTLDGDRQILTAEVRDVDLERYLPLLPEGLIPPNVEIISGTIPKAKAAFLRRKDELSFSGQAEYEKGAVRVEETRLEDIHGSVSFTDTELMLFADAEAAGQKAHVQGKLRWDTGAPYMDLHAKSDSFDPGEVLSGIPFHGAVDFQAHVTGSFKNPTVQGDFRVPSGEAEGISIRNGRAHVYFADQALYLQDVFAEVFDGSVEGEGELRLEDMAYTAHVRAKALSAAYLADYVPDVSGRLSADLGVSGQGEDLDNLELYGSVRAENASYREFPITEVGASFYAKGKDITIDYLSVRMPNHSDIGLEGNIRQGRELDVSFYGGHVDLSLFSRLIPQVDASGWGDFQGKIKGELENPRIGVKLSCIRGTLFKQPFDTLKASMGGSLNGVGIREFLMEKDGREVWQVQGHVGFVGEKRIDLRVDTVGARVEDIVALVAPGQAITGNVDNTIRFTGTLDDPRATGYIHMSRGSYNGMLVLGVDGDYFLEGDQVRLQDARIRTPMLDMDVSGTLNYRTEALDMVLSVYDIDMKRLEHRFPYGVSGHGKFNGTLRGTVSQPVFVGLLDADEIVLNEQSITGVHGRVSYENNRLGFEDFGFQQQDGNYRLNGFLDPESHAMSGKASIRNGDIRALAAMVNQKSDLLQGRLDAEAVLGGTLENPVLRLEGSVSSGEVAGYDVHDLFFRASLRNRVLNVDKLEGKQGTGGYLSGVASIDLDGPLQGSLSAHGLEAGLFTRLAGLDAKVVGHSDIEAHFGGVLQNPSAEASVQIRDGGIKGSTFDALQGNFSLKNGLIDVKELLVEKTIAGEHYQASAKGIVPLRAIFSDEGDDVGDYEQIQLKLTLDHADLSLLPVMSDHIDWALGATQGNLEISGTLAHPLVHGEIAVPDGSLKFKDLEKPVMNMRLALKFLGTSMELREFSGTMGSGSYMINGRLVLDGNKVAQYDVQADLDKLDVESKFFRGPVSGQVRIGEGSLELPDRKLVLPKISGNLFVENCLVSVPSIPDSEGEIPDMLLDFSLTLGKKVHFYNARFYDMYLDGSAHFEGTTRHPKTSGTISVRHGGTLTYLKTTFHIRTGDIYFNQVDSFLPSVSFFADTRLGRTKVFLWASGPLGGDQLRLKLGSSPEMSQTEILQLLTFRNAYKDGDTKIDMGNLLLTGVQMSVLSEVENSLRDVLYLDVFSISQGIGSTFANASENDQYYSLTIGKYVSDKVLLKYTQGFGSGRDKYRFGVTYDLTDRIGLTVEREGKNNIIGLEARIRF